MGIKVSILGATGNVGREFLSIIEERKFLVKVLNEHAVTLSMSL